MLLYAWAIIELGDQKIPRGAQVSKEDFDPESLKSLIDGGSLREQPYDPKVDKSPPPAEVEIEGVVYKQSSDGAEVVANAG